MQLQAFLIFLVALSQSLAAGEVWYSISTVAGSDNLGDGQAATLAQIQDVQGLTADKTGNLYLADAANHRIRKISPDGLIDTVAGTGQPGFSGDGGPARKALLNAPYGIAVDLAGNLFIADLGNRRIRRVSADGTIATVAGNGWAGSSGDGGPAVDARLKAPRNVAVDLAGNLYIADFEAHVIRRVTAAGRIDTWAGTGLAGFKGDGGAALEAELNAPAGLAVDAFGALYVADSSNHVIRKISGGIIDSVTRAAPSDPDLRTPTGVAFDAAGALHVADSMNRRIVKVLPDRSVLVEAGAGAPGGLSTLDAARDVTFDPRGDLYIADGRRVRRLSAAGRASVAAGDGTFGYRGDGQPAVAAMLNGPSGVAAAPDGSLYIADERNYRIRRVFPSGLIATAAGTGVPGFGYDGTTALTTPIDTPTGLTVDASGVAWFAERQGNRIRRLTPSGALATAAGGRASGDSDGDRVGALDVQLRSPGFALVDAEGALYVADTANHKVRRMAPGGLMVTIAGSGVRGGSGDGGPAIGAKLDSPRGLAIDPFGNLFVADSGNSRIRKVAPDGTITSLAIDPDALALRNPAGLAAGPGGSLYIADTGNHRIVQWVPPGLLIPIAGTGQPGFSGDNGLAGDAQLSQPVAVSVDLGGNLYVADQGNHRIRKLTPDTAISEPIIEPAALRITNAASLEPGPVAPGEMITLFGAGLGPEQGVAAAGAPRSQLADTQVKFDGQPAPLFYVQAGQINAQAPYALAARLKTTVEVFVGGSLRGSANLVVARAAPGLFTREAGLVLAVHPDGGLNSPATPALADSIVTLYATGEGQTAPEGIDGQPAPWPAPKPLLPVALAIGGKIAPLLYAGSAPGFVGLMQVNARIPLLPPGAAVIVLSVGSARSQEGLRLWVK